MKTIVFIRLSSFGDVLLTIPALYGLTAKKGEDRYILVTRHQYLDYFRHLKGLELYGADPDGRHKGSSGLIRLYKDLLGSYQPDQVIDLHRVLRTHFLAILFALSGIPVFRIRKLRRLKWKYLKRKTGEPLPHVVDIYLEAMMRAGLEPASSPTPFFSELPVRMPFTSQREFRIGMAPFARHLTKQWPLDNSLELCKRLTSDLKAQVYLFGGPDDQVGAAPFRSIAGVTDHTGRLNPQAEIVTMAELDLMITMDSANMHLASLIGVPTISIWGATHPNLGFRPYNQDPELIVQVSEGLLPCRPCSVYGGKPCKLKHEPYKCLKMITVEEVYAHVKKFAGNH